MTRRLLREAIPSFVKMWPRCHSTVRGLTKSWPAISLLV